MKLILFAFLLLIGSTCAAPSDLIKHSTPPTVIDLMWTDPSSAKAISATNENLTAATFHELEDLGPHFSGTRDVADTLTNMGVTAAQINFTKQVEAIPLSIGNPMRAALISTNKSVEFSNVTLINETLAWF